MTGAVLPLRETAPGVDRDRRAHERVRLGPEQDLPRRRRLFEACGDVDGVAHHQHVGVASNDLARVDADPHAELDIPVAFELSIQGLECGAHLGSRSHRAQRVVLVEHGIPKTAITASPMNFDTVPP